MHDRDRDLSTSRWGRTGQPPASVEVPGEERIDVGYLRPDPVDLRPDRVDRSAATDPGDLTERIGSRRDLPADGDEPARRLGRPRAPVHVRGHDAAASGGSTAESARTARAD